MPFSPQWNAGQVTDLGENLTLTDGTLASSGGAASEWTAGSVSTVGAGLGLNADTLSSAWQLGTVTALDNITLTGSVLIADLQWTAGGVANVGRGLNIYADPVTTLEAEWSAGTVLAVGSGLTLAAGGTLETVGTGGASLPVPNFATAFAAPSPASLTTNFGSAAGSLTTEGSVTVMRLTNGSNYWATAQKTIGASATLQVELGFQGGGHTTTGALPQWGVCISNGNTIAALKVCAPGANGPSLNIGHITSYSSYGSDVSVNYTAVQGNPLFLEIALNTGVVTYSVSLDGMGWDEIYSETIESFMGTPTAMGIIALANVGAPATQSIRLYQWSGI